MSCSTERAGGGRGSEDWGANLRTERQRLGRPELVVGDRASDTSTGGVLATGGSRRAIPCCCSRGPASSP
eukprot:scaffold12584_cov69-Phaeocystis_antarctica.AAC.4